MPNTPFSLQRQQYPDPFLDVASTKLPKSQKKLIKSLQYFATTHPQIAPIVKKLSRYPITRIIVNADNPGHESLEKRWREVLEDDIGIYQVLEEVGLDYNGTGNAFVTVHKPFVRTYQCKSCNVDSPAAQVDYYIRGKKFFAKCPSCKKNAEFIGKDRGLSSIDEVSIVRVPPMAVHIRHNPLTGKATYFRTVPPELKNAVKKSKPDRYYIDSTPWAYVQAAIHGKSIKFAKGKLLHLKEPTLSFHDGSWGLPIIMAALKDAYLLQVYKKADETVANERTVPARFVYPQATSQDPLRTISLSKFANFMSRSIKRFRYDKNAIMPVPFPVGVAEIGGDANRLMTAQLRELTIKEIIGSTGVPEGFLSNEMSWSGGSVQLRMLENSMMPYARALDKLLGFIVREIAKITEWETVKVKLKPFRMQDDIQQMQIIMQLAQMKHVSFKEILDRLDLNWETQHKLVRAETGKVQEIQVQESLLEARAALASVQWQTESQNRSASYDAILKELQQDSAADMQHLTGEAHLDQAEEQQDQMAEEEAANQPPDPQEAQANQLNADAEESKARTMQINEDFVNKLVTQLQAMDPNSRNSKLESLMQTAPEIAQSVQQKLEGGGATGGGDLAGLASQLMTQSKDAKDLANKLLMMEDKKQNGVFNELVKQNPKMGLLVSKEMNSLLKPNGGNQYGSSVDMRQLPQAKPPRRSN